MEKKYFKKRNGEYYTKYTKEEIMNIVNKTDPETFIWLLKELDIPWIPTIWELRSSKRNYSMLKYISYMSLQHWKKCTFKDSEDLENAMQIYKKGQVL